MSYALAVTVRALGVERVSPAEDAAAPHAADQPSKSGTEEDQVAPSSGIAAALINASLWLMRSQIRRSTTDTYRRSLDTKPLWLRFLDQVAFTAGNPRVEHITGVVHLYRDVPADSAAQPSGSDAAAPAAQARYLISEHSRFGRHPWYCLVLPPQQHVDNRLQFLKLQTWVSEPTGTMLIGGGAARGPVGGAGHPGGPGRRRLLRLPGGLPARGVRATALHPTLMHTDSGHAYRPAEVADMLTHWLC